jgi:ferritin-like metal-binding protein YciE
MTDATRDRLARYLNDAWGIETLLADGLHVLVEMAADIPGLRDALEEHRRITHGHRQQLEARLEEFGQQPSGGKGVLGQVLDRLADALHRPADPADRALHELLKVIGAVHFEMGMHRALVGFARAAGDAETARLANDHLRHGRVAARRLWSFVAPTAVRGASA